MLNPYRKRLEEFNQTFPIWKARVVKWRPSFPFGVEFWLNDGNHFIFSRKGKRVKLIVMKEGRMKGKVVYDSAEDGRKGL